MLLMLQANSTKLQRNKSLYQEYFKNGRFSHHNYLRLPCYQNWIQFSSVAQSCPTLCNPMNRSMPGLPVHHKLLEFTQTHVHRVGDAIQPSHPLSSPAHPAFNLFQWVGSSHPGAKILELQHQSFQWILRADISFRMDWFDLLEVQGTLKSLLQHRSLKASVFHHSVFLWSNSHICTWLLEKS